MKYLHLVVLFGMFFVAQVALSKSAAVDVKARVASYPEMPESVNKALYEAGRHQPAEGAVKGYAATIRNWIDQKDAHKNGVYRHEDVQMSLLGRVIQLAFSQPAFFKPVLDDLLAREPDLSLKWPSYWGRKDVPASALTTICAIDLPSQMQRLVTVGNFVNKKYPVVVADFKSDHLKNVEKIIDLAINQGISYDELRQDIKNAERSESGLTRGMMSGFYKAIVSEEALEYLHDKQAAEIAEKELEQYLPPKELRRMGAEYVAPLPKPKPKPGKFVPGGPALPEG